MAEALDPQKFLDAQAGIYADVKRELAGGHKRTHWMWFIFPQLAGLGMSPTSVYYAIPSPEAAAAYLDHPTLGARLLECTSLVLTHKNQTAERTFGGIDAVKFRSSMTLFDAVDKRATIFADALDRFYEGERDPLTLKKLGLT